MKKLFKYLMLPVLAAASFSCSRLEPIEFVHEKQAFESREGKILIEAIMPTATTADEEIYIVGAFNGDTAKAYLNPAYLMERSAVIPQKWGIYLDPNDFETGKTLADGFTFASVAQGWERTATGKPETHCLDIKAGEWANVYVDKWEKYFEKPAEGGEGLPEHEGTVRIYITDNSGWDEIALYQWGDTNDLGGGWPGMQVTGTLNYNGVSYKYFEYAEADIIGKGQNLIFNNNGNGKQHGDYKIVFEEGVSDYFLNVTADGVEALDTPGAEEKLPDHEGVRVYLFDETGWDEIALYQWGDTNDLGGGWPGMQATGTLEFKGVTYKFFDYAEADVIGKGQNLIFNNNNNGKQLADLKIVFEEGVKDYFVHATADGAKLLEGPVGGGSDTPDTPEEPEEPKMDPVTIYIDNQVGYESPVLFMFGDKEICGAWPGLAASETKEIDGVNYLVYNVDDAKDRKETLVFNDGKGTPHIATLSLTLSKDEYYLSATAEGLVEIQFGEPSVLYVSHPFAWEGTSLYVWGDMECFGAWPGKAVDGVVSISGKKYQKFDIAAEYSGLKENLIINNNGNGDQANGPEVTLGTTMAFDVDADKNWTAVETIATRVYVIDNTGWESLYLYSWGTADYFGAWPGKAAAGKQTVNGVEYTYFDVPAEAFANGGTCNFIFNNNAGTQLENFDCLKGNVINGDYFFTLTADNAAVAE